MPAAPSTLDWLSRLARAVGAADPLQTPLGPALRAALSDPPDAPRAVDNALAPGGPPVEVSFSERQPGLLRFVFEPGPRGISADQRRAEADAALRAAGARTVLPPRGAGGAYGAVVGAVVDRSGLHSVRLYTERGPHAPPPPPLAALEARAQDAVEGLVPLFWSQDLGAGQERPRLRAYLLAQGGLSFLDLDRLMRSVGAGRQAARLATALRPFADGATGWAPGWAVVGLRPTLDGVQVKVDRLRDPTAPNADLREAVDRHLSQRCGAPWTRFRDALSPPGWVCGLGAVGVSAAARGPLPVSAYWRPRIA